MLERAAQREHQLHQLLAQLLEWATHPEHPQHQLRKVLFQHAGSSF